MSKEKRIDDQAEVLYGGPRRGGKQVEELRLNIQDAVGGCSSYWSKLIAERLFGLGYRKQSEGEWIIKSEIFKLLDDVDEELYVECSICQRRFNVPYELDDEKIFKYAREHYPYCNCGAKMKGGEE